MDTKFEEEIAEQADHPHPVIITVNGHSVTIPTHRATGLEIKREAIAQGVPIHLDFALFEVQHGGRLKQIGDHETVALHHGEVFRAVAPDDNSER